MDFDGHTEKGEEEDDDNEEHQGAQHNLLCHLPVSLAACLLGLLFVLKYVYSVL